jgi:hypothetical protein
MVIGIFGIYFRNYQTEIKFFLKNLKRFKGAGIEAEMMERVDKVVEEATATVDMLRQVATPLLYTTIFSLATEGRISGMNPLQKHAMEKDLENIVKDLDIADPKITEAFNLFHFYYIADHHKNFIRALQLSVKSTPFDDSPKLFTELDNWSWEEVQTREKLLKVVKPYEDKFGIEAKESLEDYLYYFDHHELRRPEEFRRQY